VGEIESPQDGVLKGVRAGDGATVPVGETLAFVARADESVPALPALGGETPAEAPQASPATVSTAGPEAPPSPDGPIRATPVARRVAKDLGVDLSQVKGTGPQGRVKEEDVQAYAAAQAAKTEAVPAVQAPAPASAPTPAAVQTAQPTPAVPARVVGSTSLPLTHIQQITGQRMLESVHQAPHFFLQVSADMTAAQRLIETARERIEAETGARLSVTAILVKAAALALRKHPRANSSFQGSALSLHPQVNIGVAVGAEDGLVVPVIQQADGKSLAEIALELKNFQVKAGEMRFSPDELSGGTFTISNLGMYGVDVFTAIINPPQSSILAVGRIIPTPTGLDDGSISLQPRMAMTLSVDHRCMDGLQGARFLAEIKKLLEEPYLML
jgi:pyruvate dehydrogenase E2 component (dihydrolipoamide acetyltransferase)